MAKQPVVGLVTPSVHISPCSTHQTVCTRPCCPPATQRQPSLETESVQTPAPGQNGQGPSQLASHCPSLHKHTLPHVPRPHQPSAWSGLLPTECNVETATLSSEAHSNGPVLFPLKTSDLQEEGATSPSHRLLATSTRCPGPH